MPRATSYKVYKNGVLLETVTTTHSHLTGLSAATAYSMTVIAVNSAGDSAASDALTVTTANPTTAGVTDHGSQVLASVVSFGGAVNLAPAMTGRFFAFRGYARALTLAEFEFLFLNIVENNGKSVLRPN
jgi:chitodextrinase